MPLMPRLDETDLDKPASPAAGPATLAPGEYRLRIRVTDLATGQQAETVRTFVIAGTE